MLRFASLYTALVRLFLCRANATAHVNRCLDNPTAPTPVNPQLPITPHRNVEEIPDNPRRRAQVTEFKTDVPPIPAIGTVVVPGRDWSAGRRRGRNLGVLQRGVVTAHREFNHIPNSAVEIVWDTGPRTQVLRWGVTGRSVSTRVQKRTNMALDPAQRIVEELDNRLPLSRFFDVCPIPSSMQYVADSKAAQVMSETIKLPPSTVQGVLFVKVERCRGLRNGVSNKYASVTYSYVTEQSVGLTPCASGYLLISSRCSPNCLCLRSEACVGQEPQVWLPGCCH